MKSESRWARIKKHEKHEENLNTKFRSFRAFVIPKLYDNNPNRLKVIL